MAAGCEMQQTVPRPFAAECSAHILPLASLGPLRRPLLSLWSAHCMAKRMLKMEVLDNQVWL